MRLLAVFDEGAPLPRLDHVKHEMISGEPHHPPDVPNPMLAAALIGGVLGGIVGAALAIYTFRTMHLQTGHMGGATAPATGIVIFAFTALAAIASVLVAFLLSAGLPTSHSDITPQLRERIAHGAVAYIIDTTTSSVEQELRDAGGRTEWLG